MTVFENIEDIFQEIRGLNEYSKALVTLATAIGALLVFFFTLQFAYKTYVGLRLYLCSQFCCRPNFRARYGQWAVVSGSTDGIGLSMAKELAQQGLSIIVIGRNDEKLANTKQLLLAEPNVGDVLTVKIDLSDSSMENFDRIRAEIDPENRDIGLLINNAGVFESKFARFNSYEMDSILQMINVNILATVHLTRMIMPGMLKRGRGMIVNVSSLLGEAACPYMSVYPVTKTFVDRFSRQLQIEYGGSPVDIVNLTPGAVHTKLFIKTAKLVNPAITNPSPDDYAKSALNTLATRYASISGFWFHGLCMEMTKFFDRIGLIPILMRINLKLNARDVEL